MVQATWAASDRTRVRCCHVHCREGLYRRGIDGVIWRCPNCRKTINVRKGSFSEGSHLKLWQVIGLTYLWATSAGCPKGLSVLQTMRELKISGEHTIVDWNQFCRDVAVQHFVNHPERLGGNGHIVEIDESLFARRKYERGHLVRERWILGGYEAETKKGFLVPVPARDQARLLLIIQQWVEPNTMLWRGMWAAYRSLPQLGFAHSTVNHTLNFVAPLTGILTNRVEEMWQRAKAKFKAMYGPTTEKWWKITFLNVCGASNLETIRFLIFGIK